MSKVVKMVWLLLAMGAVGKWFTLSLSTKRYLIHLAKNVPYLPLRYFI